jgi:protein tyrosine/serine phosphatase
MHATFRPLHLALASAMLLLGCGQAPLTGTRATLAPQGPGAEALARKKQAAGALPMENFAKVSDALYRGGLPSDADMAGLSKLGVKTDIDLQHDSSGPEKDVVAHEKETAKKLGMKFVNLPLPWGVAPPQAMVDKLLETLSDPQNLPAYIHCKHGRDRTGTMVAIYRMEHDGLSGAQALEEMRSFGFKPKDYPFYADYVLKFTFAKAK